MAKAGRAIPIKFEVFDRTTAPVTDLAAGQVAVSSMPIDCDGSALPADAVEEYAAGGSGVQNLGDGSYQLNWATAKGYAGGCRRLRLDLGERRPDGAPAYRTVDFHFTR